MFCQNCGNQVQAGQQFCSACAKPLTGYDIAQKGRLQRHVHLLGIFWVVYSVFSLLGGAVLMIIANTLFGRWGPMGNQVPMFLHPLLSAVAVFVIIKSCAGILAGYGLLQRLSWARMLAIVMGFLDVLHMPLGTALGIYTIWTLLSPGADREYQQLAGAA
jgi:zinc-ribbon domain